MPIYFVYICIYIALAFGSMYLLASFFLSYNIEDHSMVKGHKPHSVYLYVCVCQSDCRFVASMCYMHLSMYLDDTLKKDIKLNRVEKKVGKITPTT